MRLPVNLKMVDISDLLGQVGFKEWYLKKLVIKFTIKT